MRKKKITVIGGGLGAITAVTEIMSQPNSKELYDITIYQLGWRWGGKGASGVNREIGHRVEEHGIHLWFGFYENAIRVMKQVYGSLGRPENAPMSTFDKAFKGQSTMVFEEHVDGNWVDWPITFPPMPGVAGDGKFLNPEQEIFGAAYNYLAMEYKKYFKKKSSGCLGMLMGLAMKKLKQPKTVAKLKPIFEKIEHRIEEKVEHATEKHLRMTGALLSNPENHSEEMIDHHVEHLDNIHQWLWDLIGDLVRKNNTLRRLWATTDFVFALSKGMLKDRVIYSENGKLKLDFKVINNIDYKDWFVKHGADEEYIREFPPVKSMYDGPFAFYKGHVAIPNVEAGTALNIFLRLALTCKENVIWKMQAGMGDTIFAPVYQLLKKEYPKNVHFKFFHKATNLKLDENKKEVVEIAFEEQVQLKDGQTEYSPLLNVKGLDCWPSEPLYEQLNPEQVKELKKGKIDLESGWSGWKHGQTVTKKIGVDFDQVIIGASLASLPNFCAELIDNSEPVNGIPKWQLMLDKVGTVQTQAFQLWLTKDPKELGVRESKVLSTYIEPLDTFAEMNQVLDKEVWDDVPVKPKYLLYVCGAFPNADTIPPFSDTGFPKSQDELVFNNMKNYILKHLRHVLPGAFDSEGNFDWDILANPHNQSGEERLKAQYHRANIDGSERYVFSLVDSSRFRIKTDESGYENVLLTGDWIQNGLNIGFVEGAVISGLLTARAATGNENIPIYLPW